MKFYRTKTPYVPKVYKTKKLSNPTLSVFSTFGPISVVQLEDKQDCMSTNNSSIKKQDCLVYVDINQIQREYIHAPDTEYNGLKGL